MPQLSNPSSGYLLSTNQDPFQVTAANDNLPRDNYPPELGLQTRMTNRADRGLTMFAEAGRMSEADFIAVKWDKFYDPKSRATKYVRRIADMDFEAGSLQQKAGRIGGVEWRNGARQSPSGLGGVPVIGRMESRASR